MIKEMTVGKLMMILKDLDPNLPIICTRYSDYCDVEEPTVVDAFYKAGDSYPWRQYYRGHNDPSFTIRKALHFDGN